MAVLAGGSSGALWAWNQAEENPADRVMGLQAQVGRPETWVASEGFFLRSRVGSEITELDFAITALDDGVTNGTNTLTSASGPFEPSMVGLQISVVGFGQRFVTSYTSANEIEFSGNPIAAGSGRRFTLPIGRSQFNDGELSGTSLISASAPFNPSHVGTNANVNGLGTREIIAYISPTEVTLEGGPFPAQTGVLFTAVTDIEPREVSLSSGGQVVDSHRTPRTNVATTIRWRVGDILRPRGRPREIFVPGIFIGAYPNFTNIEVGAAITPFTPFTNGSAFAVVAGSLPDGVTLNPATGEISGTPTAAGLLGGSPVGEYTGIVVQADGVANSPPFSFTVIGIALPVPDLYAPMDVNGLDGTLLAGFPVNTNVMFPGGGNGVVGDAGSWAAGDSALNYGDNAAFRLNGNTALTVATNVNPTSHPAHDVRLAGHIDAAGWALGLKATTGEVFWDARRATTDEDQRTSASVPTSSCSHVSASWVDANARADIYVDGLLAPLATDITGSGAVDDDTGEELVLGNNGLGTQPADGLQDEVAIWTQALTAEQHATLAWLAQKGDSIGEWVRGLTPNAPAYSNAGPFVIGSPITTIAPDTPSVDPEALAVTYFAYDPLPDGLSLNPANGEITGTPTATALLTGVDGVHNIRIGVSDGLNVAVSAPFDITMEGVASP